MLRKLLALQAKLRTAHRELELRACRVSVHLAQPNKQVLCSEGREENAGVSEDEQGASSIAVHEPRVAEHRPCEWTQPSEVCDS
jgi:hypothetical protein